MYFDIIFMEYIKTEKKKNQLLFLFFIKNFKNFL